ncbi:MAG TPA: hypothetical protein VN048_02640 [Verrucomicrobiae bacterium]|nr:hypothetical protein [Verrucomicrobiae bacterium]
MAQKPLRIAIALLLGFILLAGSAIAVSPLPATTHTREAGSCCSDCKDCQTPACCARPDAPAAPVTPVPAPSSSQNELQALAMPGVSILTLPSLPAHELSSRFSSPASMTAVPLFQRDCCYLI